MNVQALRNGPSLRDSVSPAEWQARVELAAAHRLMDFFGVGDLAHNHLCARVPGEPDAFLIKPAESLFDEVFAPTLAKYDFDGNPRQDGAAKRPAVRPYAEYRLRDREGNGFDLFQSKGWEVDTDKWERAA